jgi:hypothetical protein
MLMRTPTLGILMILATFGLATLAAVVLVLARLRQRPLPWRPLALAGAAWAMVYAALLVGTSLTSRERELGLDENKKFCGFYLDCHMQVAVTRVDTARQVDSLTAAGVFYVVTLRVSSDAVAARLRLLNPRLVLTDAQGHRYEPVVADRDSLSRLIGPEESFTTRVVFDVPDGAPTPRLDVTMGIWADRLIERFLIGDEDSVLHRRTSFRIAA